MIQFNISKNIADALEDLQNLVFSNINHYMHSVWQVERTDLAPRSNAVDAVSRLIFDNIPGVAKQYIGG
jgi:hypothetical protein